MKVLISKCHVLACLFLLFTSCENETNFTIKEIPRSRVIVLTDILNEPDDSQTMVRLLMYANKMDIEGLIAVSSCHQHSGKNDSIEERNDVHPEEIKKYIHAYAQVFKNLNLHENHWPSAGELIENVGAGPPEYGMSGVGENKSTSGSALIVEALLKNDPRPLYVCINAGASCLAQALFDLQNSLDKENVHKITKKLRIYDDAGQDNAGAWIAHNFPHIHYQRSKSQVFNFMNERGPVTWDSTYYPGKGQHIWAKENVQQDHGPLGNLYPVRRKWKQPDVYHTLEGGGTSTWIGHVNQGLYVPEEMTWGGWGGRFSPNKEKNVLADQLKWAGLVETENPYKPFYMFKEASDSWTDPGTGRTYNDIGTPIYRWRQAYQNDFEGRMDWCVSEYAEANHNPVAAIFDDKSNGIIHVNADPGQEVLLDANESSDPDGDLLRFNWFIYPEAGNYPGKLFIENSSKPVAKLVLPADASGKNIHVILELADKNPIVSLYDYRRIIIHVN